MAEIIDLITANGIWIFLVGAITSILLGIIKTPIKTKVINDSLTEDERKKKSNLFDTFAFLATYVLAFIGAIIYYLVLTGGFQILEILKLVAPIWLAQSMVYGFWKKLGLKRLLQMFIKLIIKDANGDGKITIDEAILQLKGAYKNGKLDVDMLVKNITSTSEENLGGVVKEVVENSEITKEDEAIVKAAKGDYSKVIDQVKEAVMVIKDNTGEKEVVDSKKVITF